ncbi:glycosyltransferase family 52 [Fusobacterium mortiferum]|uniref:glycosyltransferase family 52 n=1 Tax=Fusobacterium mortiferum TaxID=850 RepID=UPI00356259FF
MKYKIFKGHNSYQLLQYLLLTKKEERFFIFTKKFLSSKIKNQIEKEYPTKVLYLLENEERNIFKKYLKKIYIDFYYSFYFTKKFSFLVNSELLGDLINIIYFQKICKISILEDGLGTHKVLEIGLNKEKEYLKKYIKIVYNLLVFQNKEIDNYFSNKINNIYLSLLPQIIYKKIDIHKIKILNLNKYWKENKTKSEKEEILKIFYINDNLIKKIHKKKIILYTQPLSEDEIISEQEKIELYSKIILQYPKEKLILKRHPREITNYKNIFKDIFIIEENFPSEILELLEIRFEKVVTVFSTAVLNIKSEGIDFYGTEVHPKLLKRFGSMDHIIKRNAFL